MKKKVLIIHESMSGGGAERVLATILSRLDRDRFDITLLLIYGAGTFLKAVPADIRQRSIFRNYDAPLTRLLNHFAPVRNRYREAMARRLLKGERFDVTVSFMEGPTAKLHSQLLDLAPLNMTWVHNNLQDARWYGYWITPEDEARFYASVDRIAFVSEGNRQIFSQMFKSRAELRVVHNPVDTASIKDDSEGNGRRKGSGKFSIVTMGRLVRQKRQDRLIEAARLLSERGYDFSIDIYGSGPLEQQLKAQAEDAGVGQMVSFKGFVEDPYSRIKDADIFCLTSEAEGFGMVVAEALVVGTPVVSTTVNGVTDMLANGGGILTGHAPVEIADALARVMDSPRLLATLRSQTAEAGRQFDIDTVMGNVSEFIGS
ncbi:MAG: glycosyltransferase [Muribaculaceae bacterium]|nr:glycosyltransferase [Muribaculaceae bacterium]